MTWLFDRVEIRSLSQFCRLLLDKYCIPLKMSSIPIELKEWQIKTPCRMLLVGSSGRLFIIQKKSFFGH